MVDTNAAQVSELIHQAQQGNIDAFNHLVLKYQDLLYNYAYTLMGIRQSAEDTTQESIFKAFQKIHQYRGGSFRCWLFKIVTNTCYDELRRLKHHPVIALDLENEHDEETEALVWLFDPHSSVDSIVEQHEFSKKLSHDLDELPDIYRRVITLIDVYEFDYCEASDILKIPLGTLKSRLARARFQLKEKLQLSMKDPSPKFATFVAHPI